MWVISEKILREFWNDPKYKQSKTALSAWHKNVRNAKWANFAEVKDTYNSVDKYENKIIFDVGGNKYRVIAVIDFKAHKVFIRAVLDHKEYDEGKWKDDTFGEDW